MLQNGDISDTEPTNDTVDKYNFKNEAVGLNFSVYITDDGTNPVINEHLDRSDVDYSGSIVGKKYSLYGEYNQLSQIDIVTEP